MSSGGIMGSLDRAPGNNPLSQTFSGYISTTMDALILFEACLNGTLSHVSRRPHDRERAELITSGNIFIYEESASGIKRWTDGMSWSPSRILGNFLLYRELDKPFQPGEKKRALKRPKTDGGVSKPQAARASSIGSYSSTLAAHRPSVPLSSMATSRNATETERALVGSLVDSYQFKKEGLVKKTISVTHNGIQHHLVSYYTIADVVSGSLETPTNSRKLSHISPRPTLISSGNFRAPVDDQELVVSNNPAAYLAYNPQQQPHGYGLNGADGRSMSLPNVQYTASYGAPSHSNWGGSGYQPYSQPYNNHHAGSQQFGGQQYDNQQYDNQPYGSQSLSGQSYLGHSMPNNLHNGLPPIASSSPLANASSSAAVESFEQTPNVAGTTYEQSPNVAAMNYEQAPAATTTINYDQTPNTAAISYEQTPNPAAVGFEQTPSGSAMNYDGLANGYGQNDLNSYEFH